MVSYETDNCRTSNPKPQLLLIKSMSSLIHGHVLSSMAIILAVSKTKGNACETRHGSRHVHVFVERFYGVQPSNQGLNTLPKLLKLILQDQQPIGIASVSNNSDYKGRPLLFKC